MPHFRPQISHELASDRNQNPAVRSRRLQSSSSKRRYRRSATGSVSWPDAKCVSCVTRKSASHDISTPAHKLVHGSYRTIFFVSLTNLLTYSMVQSPSWEANWSAASQEIHRISQNPKVHYRTNKRPPPVPILGQPNPVHIPTSHLLEIHPNIIHPSAWVSPVVSFPPVSPPRPYAPPFPHEQYIGYGNWGSRISSVV